MWFLKFIGFIAAFIIVRFINAFYMNPGCDNPGYLKDFYESPIVLMTMQQVLNQTRLMMEKKALKIGHQLPIL